MEGFEDRPEGAASSLWCEGVALNAIADAVGAPVYVYSTDAMRRRFLAFRDAFASRAPLIAYAVKANGALAVVRTLARLGAGADTVSEGEVRLALAAGVPAGRIVFSGVGKTDAELAFALDAGVLQINVESEPELRRLATIAAHKGVRAAVALRVNPDIGAGGHAKISTGSRETKFGVSMAEAERLYHAAAAAPSLRPVGVACHIGSQIADLEPLTVAYAAMRALVERLRGQGAQVERLDLGGGLASPYFDGPRPPAPLALAATVERALGGLQIGLAFEPGRVIVANAGVLVASVIHVHERPEGRRFLVVDAGMNDLMRPALYDAFHAIRPLATAAEGAPRLNYDVVGPVCETSDIFARGRALPAMAAGDRLAFLSAGAYGASMANAYNARPLVPEVLVDGDRWAVIRPRPTYAEMLARERSPDWLA